MAVSLPALFLIALGVSADAFAVSLGKGLQMRRLDLRAAGIVAGAFGAFQAGMPLLGYLLGSQLERSITSVDHWIAFGLLAVVGLKMIREALSPHDDSPDRDASLDLRELLVLSVATSIDALAVGIGFAFLEIDIALAVLLIGGTTAVLSFGGVVLGHRAGTRFRTPAELAGGLILIAIGTKILFDHIDLF